MAKTRWPLLCALALVSAVAYWNPGFIAVDDYASNIEIVVPAQSRDYSYVIRASDFRPPFANLFLVSVTKIGYRVGLDHPLSQLWFLRWVLGILAVILFYVAILKIFPAGGSRLVASLILLFHFLTPLLFTRPLVEAMSAPLLLMSCSFAVQYWRHPLFRSLAWAAVWLVGAAIVRFQSGICVIALLGIVAWKRRWRDLGGLLLVLAGLFILVGLWDWALKGEFHSSLITYMNYNLTHSASYGTSPFYSYGLLFLALSFFPFLLGGYCGFDGKRRYGPLVPIAAFFFVFVLTHSFVGHKEERFMVPVLPLFLLLGVPVAQYWYEIRGGMSARLFGATILNGVLLCLASFHTPQSNVIDLARFIEREPNVTTLIGIGDTLAVFPRVFMHRSVLELSRAVLSSPVGCESRVAVRRDLLGFLHVQYFEKVAEFHPGILEKLIIALNPSKNKRRDTIELWRSRTCASVQTAWLG